MCNMCTLRGDQYSGKRWLRREATIGRSSCSDTQNAPLHSAVTMCPSGESETAAPTPTTDRTCTGARAQSGDSSSGGSGTVLGIAAGGAGGAVLVAAIVILIVLRRARAARYVCFSGYVLSGRLRFTKGNGITSKMWCYGTGLTRGYLVLFVTVAGRDGRRSSEVGIRGNIFCKPDVCASSDHRAPCVVPGRRDTH